MITLVLAVIAYCHSFLIGRHRLGLEVAALHQQLAVLKRKQPRPHLCDLDRAFWVALRRLWPCPAKHSKSLNPLDSISVGVDWHAAELRDSAEAS
jgi:hypothetical protein